MRIRQKLISSKVAGLLETNGIESAPVNVGTIAEKLNLEIIRQDADENLSGFLMKGIDNGGIIGVNRSHNLNRQRFTIAHEIGHFVLHNYSGVHFDNESAALQIYRRDENSSTGLNPDEREANLFAAELLMPRFLIEKEIEKIERLTFIEERDSALSKLAKKFRVSQTAMTYRLASLGY